jgi:hypothetical protein
MVSAKEDSITLIKMPRGKIEIENRVSDIFFEACNISRRNILAYYSNF